MSLNPDSNVFQLPQRAPFSPITAFQAVLLYVQKVAVLKRANYELRGGRAFFDWDGRSYEMTIQDLGPAKEGA